MAGNMIYVDTSELDGLLSDMKSAMSSENFDKLMRKSLRQTGKKTVTESRKEILKKYYGGTDFVKKAIGKPNISGGGYNMNCRIKVEGSKGSVGGSFAAQGGHYGWNPPKYQIKAKIVKGQTSVLPSSLSRYGGQPPFRNLGGGGKRYINKRTKLNLKYSNAIGNGGAKTLVVTRTKPEANPYYTHSATRVPYVSVKGLAVPQMVMNRAKDGIENKITINLESNVIGNFSKIFG